MQSLFFHIFIPLLIYFTKKRKGEKAMETNLTKQTVKNEQKIFCSTTETTVEGSISLKNGNGIKKLLKVGGHSVITSKTVIDKTATVEGTTTFDLIYIDTENRFACHEHSLPFSKTLDADEILYGSEITVQVTEEKHCATIVNEETISLSAKIGLKICADRAVEEEIVCDIQDRDIELLYGRAEATTSMGKGEKNLIIEQEISVGNGKPCVGGIIRRDACFVIDECKIISGKVMVKGTVKVYILYMPQEGTRPQSFEDSFVFSQLMDVDGITEECKCDCSAEILFLDLTPKADDEDEIRTFSVTAKLCLSVKAYCENDIAVVIDAYSTKGNCDFGTKDTVFKKIKENISERFIAKKDIEFTDGAIGSVIDLWCDVKNSVCKCDGEGIKIIGTVLINLLAYDCDGEPQCYERPIDFEYFYKSDLHLLSPEVSYSVNIPRSSYTILGANTISVSVEPQVKATLYDKCKMTVIGDVTYKEISADENKKSCIVLYFAEKGEKVWDIARKYNSSVQEIKELNSVNEDVLSTSKKFIIPTK